MNQIIGNNTNLQMRRKKYGFLMMLLSLYIFFLYTAQETLLPTQIHSVVMYCLIACTFISLFFKKGGKILIPSYSVWYAILIVLGIISFLWATDIVVGAIYTMVVSLIITFCFAKILDTPEKLDVCLRIFVLSADVMGILLILTGQLTNDFDGERLGQSTTGNANIFSALMMIAAVFAIWLVLYKSKKKIDKLFNLISYLFILFMMAFSGGRKTLIAVVICTLFFIIFKNGTKKHKMIKNVMLASIVVIVLYYVIMTIPVFYEAIGQRFEGLFEAIRGGTSTVHSDKTREILVKIALKKWQERPIFGYGVDTFKYYNRTATGHFYYAHNNYVELLYDLGLVGFLLYYGYIFKLGYSLLKEKNEHREYKILGIALILETLVFDVGGVSYYTVMIQIIISLVYLCSQYNKK